MSWSGRELERPATLGSPAECFPLFGAPAALQGGGSALLAFSASPPPELEWAARALGLPVSAVAAICAVTAGDGEQNKQRSHDDEDHLTRMGGSAFKDKQQVAKDSSA